MLRTVVCVQVQKLGRVGTPYIYIHDKQAGPGGSRAIIPHNYLVLRRTLKVDRI